MMPLRRETLKVNQLVPAGRPPLLVAIKRGHRVKHHLLDRLGSARRLRSHFGASRGEKNRTKSEEANE
jgi:hypothetical protein